ncbi:probable G-protein coupled receptor Mth-like 3 [Bactrocera dorsalis]|uniref:Probable G-protein coupled receptor Mth-like 3 n=1 Tax=Bactrocera dorsalis TaxID=27457 RepID=A0A6I9VDB7_BACDO|nr:probable G-protein coupled receptor Mth-like 3 [Bactrocera dorsalis]
MSKPYASRLILLALMRLLYTVQFALADIRNCDFKDTVSLVNIRPNKQGAYEYGGISIPKNLTANYDYEELADGTRVTRSAHTRGCACKLKQCIQLCCMPQQLLDKQTMKCVTPDDLSLEYLPELEIFSEDLDSTLVDVNEAFIPQQRLPCDNFAILSPWEFEDDAYILFENASILHTINDELIPYRDNCLTPYWYNNTVSLNPIICYAKTAPTTYVNLSFLAISVPFLLATIWVYLYVPQLRCLHNSCLICFLATFAIGTALLSSTAWITYGMEACRIIGTTCYFFMISAFFWLNITCFDLWLSIRGIRYELQLYNPRLHFIYYSIYVWTAAVIFTVIAVTIEHSNINDAWKPGIGIGQCFIKSTSAMLYFHGPSGLLIIFNIFFFILSVNDLYQIKDANYKINGDNSQQYNFATFVRLFIIMGISWIMEVIPYITPINNSNIFKIFNIINTSQGIIIFGVLVLKPRVLILLKSRWKA